MAIELLSSARLERRRRRLFLTSLGLLPLLHSYANQVVMYPTKASPHTSIDFFCSDEDLFLSLEKLQRGTSLPDNVIDDVDPFQYMPSYLPDGFWFFVRAGEKARTSSGFWKIKGEACSLFFNQFITGWRTTFEYYEGQAPDTLKTDWLMHEYWIVQRKIRETGKTKEASSLFRVFLGGEFAQNDKKIQKMSASNTVAKENQILSKQSAAGSQSCSETSGSRTNPQVGEDEEPVQLRAEMKFSDHHNLHQENVDESDYVSMGDYLELGDLSPSPAASSANSSCVTMSSDEIFDSLDLLQELEHEINLDLISRNASCESTISAPLRLDEVVNHYPSSSVNSGKIVEENWNRSHQKEQPSNRPRNLSGDSSNSGASSSGDSITDGEKKGKRARKKHRKFLCFPF